MGTIWAVGALQARVAVLEAENAELRAALEASRAANH